MTMTLTLDPEKEARLRQKAETLGATRVFTLDRHFYAYRLTEGRALEVMP